MSLFGGGAKSAATTPTKALGINFQSSQYGPPITVLFGQNKVSGNCIWYGDFKATAHTQSTGGGKGGGGGSSSTSYTYSASFELGLCEGPATVVNVYEGSSTVNLSSARGIAFSGTQGQAPWSHLSGDAALGYSGTALVAFQNLQLGSSASLPNYNFEMAGRNQWGSGILDANPANIVEAICTDTQIGINFGALGDLTQFSNYCVAAGIFFSPIYDTQNPAQQALSDLLKYSNCEAYFSEGVLKIVPYCDETITGNGVTFTPDVTAVADLGPDDFITNGASDPVTIKRIGPADAMNIQRVEFNDRSNTYHTSGVVASIDQDVVGTGARADNSDSVNMITSAAVARLVAQNLLQRTYYIRNTYEFQLSWRYCYLEPMDVVTLTDANTGLALAPVRITDVAEDEHGLLSITAEEFPEGVSHAGAYGTQANNGGSVNPNTDPGPVDAPYIFRGPGFLTSNQYPEIWFALSADSEFWAGCDIYLSQDGTSYTYLSTTTRRASYGVTTNAVAIEGDPDNTSAPNVALNGSAQLLGGTQADADGFVTMAMLDTEIISYETAALEAGPSYTLGYLRRGGYGSTIAAHAVGAPFVRLDDNIVRVPVDPSQIGQTVYLKFVSFNVFGKGGRTLADETAYEYVVGTNVELPDVPVTPADVLVFGVADGVAITWENPNPAAVHTTSIEYSSSSTGPWTVLAQVGPTTTAYTHHFTTSTTYYYRLRSRGPLVSAGWSAYSTPNNGTGNSLSALQEEVSTISGEVTSATASAAAANAQLADIANPDVLTPGEKPPVIADYTNLTSEQSGIDAQATSYGITTQKTSYDNALSALTTYLGTLTTPTNWNDKTGNTTIVPATFSGKFSAVYTARQALLNTIYQTAQSLANNAQSTANTADSAAAAAQSTANSANSAASAAQTAANNAQTSANAAEAQLADIGNDNLLTPGEKPTVITDYNNITGEQSGIDAQASAYGITSEKTTYDNAVSSLTTYLNGLTTPVKWNDNSGNTTIVGTTFSANFTTVYTARQALLNAIYAAAQTLANNAQSAANTAQTAANTANTAAAAAQSTANSASSAASTAQASANTANAGLADIANDGILSSGEKGVPVRDYSVILSEQSGIDAQAVAFLGASSAQQTAYDASITSLTSYLNGLTSPTAWNDIAGNTTVVGATFRANFASVYSARQALLNAIYAAAQALANAAQGSANNAQTAVNNLNIINLSMAQGMLGWTAQPSSDAANWYAETGPNGPNGGTNTYIVHKVSGVTSTLENTWVPCLPGQIIKAQGQCRGVGSPNGAAALYIAFYDINKTYISGPNSNNVSGNGQFQLSLIATAPTNAAFVTIGPAGGYAIGTPQGYYTYSNFSWNYQPSSVAEVPESEGLYYASQHGANIAQQWATSGENLVVNGGFESNTAGAVNGANVVDGSSVLCDGWSLYEDSGPTSVQCYWYTSAAYNSGHGLLLRATSGFSVPASSGYAQYARVTSQQVNVNYGDTLSVGCDMSTHSGSASINLLGSLRLYFVLSDASTIEYAGGADLSMDSAWQSVGFTVSVPNNTPAVVGVRVECALFYENTSSSPVTIPDTSSYAMFDNVWMTRNDLRTAGSGVQIGDQRNLPAITFSNYGSGWSGLTLSYSSTSTSATISASAGTLQAGSTPISYNASSVTVSGSAGTSATYYLYYNDPVHAGGSQTLYATTNQITSLSDNGNVLLGTASVTFPTSGSGSGTGGGPCPLRSAWVIRRNPRNGATQYIRAGAVRVGDYLLLTDESWGEVVHSQARDTECVRVLTGCGTLGCSTTAPIATEDGDVLALDVARKRVQLRGFGMREAVEVRSLGVRAVQHITMRGPERHFWTGDAKSCLFAHHNMKPPPIG